MYYFLLNDDDFFDIYDGDDEWVATVYDESTAVFFTACLNDLEL